MQLLVGQDAAATEKHWDMLRRSSAPYGGAGLASSAIGAVDIALWDLKDKLFGRPVYELLDAVGRQHLQPSAHRSGWIMRATEVELGGVHAQREQRRWIVQFVKGRGTSRSRPPMRSIRTAVFVGRLAAMVR